MERRARELGPLGMQQWGNVQETPPPMNETGDIAITSRVLAQMGVVDHVTGVHLFAGTASDGINALDLSASVRSAVSPAAPR
jgi:hypothetical protein